MGSRTIDRAPYDGEYRKMRGPNGRRLCRWCGKEAPEGRRTWCSQACVDEYLVRRSPADARRAVYRRDRGVCVLCGLDTEALKREAAVVRWWSRAGSIGPMAWLRWYEWQGMPPAGSRVTYWDADHIVPVVEGGGGCGIDNLRTLCLWCHKSETAELAARRAAARRRQLALELPEGVADDQD